MLICYNRIVILSFQDKATEDIFNGINSKNVRKIPVNLWKIAARKLDIIYAAHSLNDLLAPPGNRLEQLRGHLKDFCSIRINNQYRVIFKWSNGNAEEVKITDYH